MDGNKVRHFGKAEIYGRATNRAKGVVLLIAAIAGRRPDRSLAFDGHRLVSGKYQIGTVTGSASLLAVAALTMAFHDRCGGYLEADGATGASAGITAPQLPYLWFPDSAPTEPQPAQDGAAETR